MSKLKLNEILASVDMNAKHIWDELTEEQRKSVVYFTLNRYISNVQGSRELKEHYVLLGNERFNKNLFLLLNKHDKLLWQLACSCGHEEKNIHRHEWLGLKREKNKKEEFLKKIFPDMKSADISTLAAMSDNKEIKDHCRGLGWDKKQIDAIKL
tara:strand:- start:30 stop:491 length:462 start_codon:yes stop_codon:yes gene_type:complete